MNAATSNVGMAYASTGMSNGNGGMGTFSAPMYASSGMCIPNGSANAAGSTDLSNRSSSYISLASSVFAENPLIDSLLDRYNEANHRVLQLELKSEELSKQIAVATYKGLYAASPLMTQLNELKPLLDVAKGLRDGVLIVMIIQSNDIMNAVRRLRLNDLFDVPQVPIVSHRKVLQLSIQINKQKKATMEMNRKMSVILNEPPSGNASSLTASIRAISRNIQMLEESMKKLKKDREAEIVRIVQFSEKVREELKREFHRNVEVQREQQQQAQSFR
ncbi:hypothetical protein PHYBOEH_004373 [Phytophthora boehmeriae]|uniref:Uncharacterized protein n=1 Tax=Phytophthora boehmeriae TaxID=109152 RepID=A0A8T1WRP7_9STRA|nr:hypothetical protein PHYBOEH_004373 [Phytophthora boehmeriae]